MQDAHGTDVGIAPGDRSDEDPKPELVHAHEKRHDIFLRRFADQVPEAAAKPGDC